MTINYYRVGGWVRDQIMGIQSSDIDYSVEAPSYEAMREDIIRRGGDIKVDTPEYLTIRAVMDRKGMDFVLCRKEGQYFDGRHPESVEVGTLDDDLARRDFTMNAIAMTDDGIYYDPYNGIQDIQHKIIKAVNNPYTRIKEDYVRMLRAIRFEVTKGFHMDTILELAIQENQINLMGAKEDRVRDELTKMFRYNTFQSLHVLRRFPMIEHMVFTKFNLWLKPTSEQR